MRISISGHIGSGKTTVSNILGKLTGYKVYSGGYFFRKLADEMGVSIEDLNLLAEKDDTLDFKLNEIIEQFMKENDCIIVESRLSGWISYRAGIETFRIFLDASLDTRVSRVSKREDLEDVRNLVKLREDSENLRFLKFFNFRMEDKSIYDTVINTETGSAEEIANKIYKLVFPNPR